MREILFRGKRVDNGEWVQGYPCRYGWTGKEKDYIIPDYASALYTAEIDPETVGQYTGLTDVNGNKIFEGDIVSSGTINPYTISFNQTLCCFYLKRCDLECGGFFTAGDAKCIEVIGNIYDNPELQTIERTYINERENRRSTKEYY